MARIVYRGAYATFPMVGLTAGDLAYATDLLVLFEWSGTAWRPYYDYPDYEGGKSKLYTAADWAALEAYDTDQSAGGLLVLPFGGVQAFGWVIPAGRTLYITQAYLSNRANLAADGDNNQMCRLSIQVGGAFPLAGASFNGGGVIFFHKPIVALAGVAIAIAGINYANHNTIMWVGFSGYLI